MRRLGRLVVIVGLVVIVFAVAASAALSRIELEPNTVTRAHCKGGRLVVANAQQATADLWCANTTTTKSTSTTQPATTTSTAATTTSTVPVPPGSWGCGQSVSNYGPDGTKYELNTDVFAPVQPFSSTICGNNQSFYADVQAGNCGGCVQSYPSIKYRYDQSSWVGCCGQPGGSIPFGLIRSYNSSWNVSFDHTTNSQAAYDFWFRNNCGALGRTSSGDLMIWVDTTASRGTGGGPVRNNNLVIDGRSTTLIQYGTPGVDTTETIYQFNTNEASGTIDLMASWNQEIANGDLRACDSRGLMIGNADFGYEVAGTGGVTKRFNVPDFHFHLVTTDGIDHG